LYSFSLSLSAFRTHPPVSVSRTVSFVRFFPVFPSNFLLEFLSFSFSLDQGRSKLASFSPRSLRPLLPFVVDRRSFFKGTVIFTPPSGSAFQLSIRDRLILDDPPSIRSPVRGSSRESMDRCSPSSIFSLCWNLWVYGRMDSLLSILFVTHVNILTSDRSRRPG